ncbi:hypothetical protein ACHAWF_009959 [Thalassiosira exigua]
MRCSLFLLNMTTTTWAKLSRAWAKDFVPPPAPQGKADGPPAAVGIDAVQRAVRRTLPLLHEDPSSVPFICRYRTDVIEPLSAKEVHRLSEHLKKYESLSSMRGKILEHLRRDDGKNGSAIERVETSISKSELDDIYAPFKPPSKGSLESRIEKEHPGLVSDVEELWNNFEGLIDDSDFLRRLKPADKAVILLANRIAAEVSVMDALMDYCEQHCRAKVKRAGGEKQKTSRGKSTSSFEAYHDYSNRVIRLQDHQVLAIRRGVDQKQLRLSFDVDDARAERVIRQAAFSNKRDHKLYRDARNNAWTRLLRKRCTARLWRGAIKKAEARSVQVFCDNLRSALLSPPAMIDECKALLALDPGFRAGIKCAILTNEGKVASLDTIKFMGNDRVEGKKKLMTLLRETKELCGSGTIPVVLGNGHGTREARQLLEEAASDGHLGIHVQLTSEAGASVWSVTDGASTEFPNETPAAIASVSLGRRFLNPLNELVKIPPRSLGLGMYQHDVSDNILDEKLTQASIDCVAEVGVDLNSCSAAILEKIPSLTAKLCSKIMHARPLGSRNDLLNVPGLGPKTFQNCAAFVRVTNGKEPLDATLVHPESYDLARWLLKKLRWKLSDATSIADESDLHQREEWKSTAKTAAGMFEVSEDRVLTVIEHLYYSITSPDPRRRNESKTEDTMAKGSLMGCSSIPSHLSTVEKLRESELPLRNIVATVRNVVDFGAFVDVGLENDGLLHRTKMGDTPLGSLLVGQDLGVDILGVSAVGKISVGLSGLDLPSENSNPRESQILTPAGHEGRGGVELRKPDVHSKFLQVWADLFHLLRYEQAVVIAQRIWQLHRFGTTLIQLPTYLKMTIHSS